MWKCENVKLWNRGVSVKKWKGENVKMWKCETVKSWCFRKNVERRKRENVKMWKCEIVKSWCFRQKEKKEKRRNLPLRAASNGAVPDTFWYSPHNRRSDIQITCSKKKHTQKSVELKSLKFISSIFPRNENKSITRENKNAVIQHFSEYIRWEQYLKSF